MPRGKSINQKLKLLRRPLESDRENKKKTKPEIMKANPDCKTEQFFTYCEQFADITKPHVVSFPSEMSNQ